MDKSQDSSQKTQVKFIPGPWTVELKNIDGPVIMIQHRKGDICCMPPWDKNGAYNAFLIAAAPAMYALLSQLVETPLEVRAHPGVWLEVAKFVLAKARGEK